MIFSRTATHGIYAICHLNRQRSAGVLTAAAVGESLGITEAHAAKVLKRLASAGIISSVRGRNGGFLLEKALQDIAIVDVLDAFNPSEEASRLAAENCRQGESQLCGAHRGLVRLERRMWNTFAGETLAGLAGSICISAQDCATRKRTNNDRLTCVTVA